MVVFKMDFSKLLSSVCKTWISWNNADGDMPQSCAETLRTDIFFCIGDF